MAVSGGIDLVVFDMAGTTVDVGDGIPIAFAETMATAGVAVTADQIAGVRGASKREAIHNLLRALAPARLSEADQIYDTFRAKLDDAAREFKPAPGIEPAMETLRARGIRVALNTGFDRDLTDTIIRALSWSTLADVVVTGDDVERGRPAPDLIRRAMALTASPIRRASPTSATPRSISGRRQRRRRRQHRCLVRRPLESAADARAAHASGRVRARGGGDRLRQELARKEHEGGF